MTHKVTLIPGDGIGPEVTQAVVRIIEASGHLLYHPGIRNAVMRAIADLASKSTTQTGTP